MSEDKNYTVQDVAELAAVSTATVSRVFNTPNKVNKTTLDKVLNAANKLNYRPSRVAKRLRGKRGKSMVIGVIIPDLQNPFFSEIARGIEDLAYENKNGIIICNSDEDFKKEQFYIDTLLSEEVSGLIMAPTSKNEKSIQTVVDKNIPIVFVDRYLSRVPVDTVTVNNQEGAYRAVNRLIELGHRRIGIINGIKGLSTTRERYQGYIKALEEKGIKPDDELIIYGNSKESGGIEGTRKLLSLGEPPTAIFSTNNLMTLGCLEEIHRQRVSIPGELAIIGFDDMSWSSALKPPLTAVRQPAYELGVNAAELLMKRISLPERTNIDLKLEPKLILRKSCGTRLNEGRKNL